MNFVIPYQNFFHKEGGQKFDVFSPASVFTYKGVLSIECLLK